MRHVGVTGGHTLLEAEEHVEGGDGTGGRVVDGVVDLAVDDQRRDLLEIRQRHEEHAAGFEYPVYLFERLGDLKGFEVFQVVRGPDGVHAVVVDLVHVDDVADDVWLGARVDVEGDLLPLAGSKALGQSVRIGVAAADVQETLLLWLSQERDEARELLVCNLHSLGVNGAGGQARAP